LIKTRNLWLYISPFTDLFGLTTVPIVNRTTTGDSEKKTYFVISFGLCNKWMKNVTDG